MNKFDMDTFGQMLLDKTIALELENERLKEKLAHLEALLINSPIVTVGS